MHRYYSRFLLLIHIEDQYNVHIIKTIVSVLTGSIFPMYSHVYG
jgi:hypothetical protein